jgi:methionyl aminopeptidase
VIIHGIPNDTVLEEGDILGIDIGSEVDGYYGDAAITMPIWQISQDDEKLIACSKDALYMAIDAIRPGMRFKELSKLLEDFITERGFVPLRDYSGHGIGTKPHEEPSIPNYLEGKVNQGPKIKNGMVFCLEPMICQKADMPVLWDDGWSVESEDGLRTAHYEHQVAVVDGKAVILTLP